MNGLFKWHRIMATVTAATMVAALVQVPLNADSVSISTIEITELDDPVEGSKPDVDVNVVTKTTDGTVVDAVDTYFVSWGADVDYRDTGENTGGGDFTDQVITKDLFYNDECSRDEFVWVAGVIVEVLLKDGYSVSNETTFYLNGVAYDVTYYGTTESGNTWAYVGLVLGPIDNYLTSSMITSGVAHVQDLGNVSYDTNSDGILTIGTTGMGKRLEEITINFENYTSYKGTLQYRVHVQDIGWTDWVNAGEKAGTEGLSKRIEAIEIRLTDELAENYSVEYCVHIQDYGDMQGWVKDGALAGTTGESKRIEELKIRIVPKNSGSSMSVKYRVHVQDYGWEKSYASNGAMSGTSGESKRLEGIELFLSGTQYSGGIKYKTHVQDYGWQGWCYDGEMSGTQGESKRLEGICIELYGEIANYYDIYYRVHAQDIGWMGWAKNGECAGTAGRSARLEGIQIVLVPKGSPAPSATCEGITAVTDLAFVEGF